MAVQSNLAEFNRDLRGFNRQVEADLGEYVLGLGIGLSETIVLSTPVDTGRTAASWTIALGEPDPEVQEEDFFGGYNEALDNIRRQHRRISGIRRNPYQQIWISNNLPHVAFLEYGTPRMQAFGMVRSSLQYILSQDEG